MQCVEIMSLAQKHENDVYLQATTANSFVKLVPIFYPRKGFSQVTRALQRCFIWAPPLPGLPLIVNFDGQRLSPSLEQSLNCVYLCTCEQWTLSSLEQSLNSKRNSFLLRETQFSQIAFRAGGCKAFEVERDRKQQFICEQEKGTQESHNLSKIQFCSSFARRICSF